MDSENAMPGEEELLADVLDGLSQDDKTLPSRWLYDERGSELFEEITQLPEYYPTRTEAAIFKTYAGEMAEAIGPEAVLVEYGAGAAVKTRIVLDALERPAAYVPLDISEDFLRAAAADLAADYPKLSVVPVAADFSAPVDLDALGIGAGHRVGFFPGSTIGNLTDGQIVDFFSAAAKTLGAGAKFLLGADLRKSPDILVPAYDDAAGVTAAFNLNLLTRLNRELGADFNVEAFRHEARWNDEKSWIEMHLVSTAAQTATIAGRSFDFAEGESIHTEISRKFDMDGLAHHAARGGWRYVRQWTDEKDWFCVALLERVA